MDTHIVRHSGESVRGEQAEHVQALEFGRKVVVQVGKVFHVVVERSRHQRAHDRAEVHGRVEDGHRRDARGGDEQRGPASGRVVQLCARFDQFKKPIPRYCSNVRIFVNLCKCLFHFVASFKKLFLIKLC